MWDQIRHSYEWGGLNGATLGAEHDTRVIQLPSSSPIDPFTFVLLAHVLETFSSDGNGKTEPWSLSAGAR